MTYSSMFRFRTVGTGTRIWILALDHATLTSENRILKHSVIGASM